MSNDRDIDELFRRFADLDCELKELKAEVWQIKNRTSYNPFSNWVDTANKRPEKPAQWPNEPYTDYLKRIGEYNEASVYEDDLK